MATRFYNISIDENLSENSNTLVPSQKAVRNFIASKAIQLDFLQATAPITYVAGQKWLDTTNQLLYTAISSSSWGTGKSIEVDQFFTFKDLLYYYDGTSINSYSTLSITEQNQGIEVKQWYGTRQEYQALSSIDPTTVYNVIENNIDYAFLATQTEFNNSSNTTAATPYQVNQELGNYLPKSGGNLDASAVLRLTNANNEVSTLAFNTSGQLTISTSLNVNNDLSTNSLVVRSGNIYKINTSGAKAIWNNDYATTTSAGVVKVDGSTIIINDGVISASGTTIAYDDSLNTTSTNAVQNKVVTTALNGKQATLSQGTGITISNNTVSLNAATSTTLGGVIIDYDSQTNTLDIRTTSAS